MIYWSGIKPLAFSFGCFESLFFSAKAIELGVKITLDRIRIDNTSTKATFNRTIQK